MTTASRGGFFGDRSSGHSALSGYAAATLGSFGGFSLTTQVARGFRDPVLSDRYFRGVTGRGFITGNPELSPETSIQLDTALRYTGHGFRGAFYFYDYRFRDRIERYQDGPDRLFFRNRGAAYIRGIELEAQGEIATRLTLHLTFQHQRGETREDRAPLDDLSPTTATMQLRKAMGERAFVQVRGAYYAADDEAGPSEVKTPGYTLVDLSAGWPINRAIELRVLGRNLLGASYPVSPDSRAVLAPGISGLVTLLFRL